MDNTIMLITYADSLGKNLKELGGVLRDHLDGVVGAVHILPFFPSSADRGFAPMRYDMVDPAFGDFEDIRAIAQRHAVMFDFMVNHISAHSPYFEDFLKNKDASPYRDMFIRYKDFWPGGAPTEDQVDRIYKRKPRAPSITVTFADGTTEDIWCTFCEEQIDLNMNSAVARKFIRSTLRDMCEKGAAVIRLDAFAYAVKKPDTSCFFIEPEMWELLEDIEEVVKPYGVDILPEIHEHYTIQQKIADKGFWVYDFALPMLVLHALYTGKGEELVHWLNICPRRQFTTLDTHDGIGVVDVRQLFGMSAIKISQEIDMVINLEPWDDHAVYDRLGLEGAVTEILGVSVPSITIPVKPGRNLASIVEVAAINNRNRKMGHNAALELTRRMDEHFKKLSEEEDGADVYRT